MAFERRCIDCSKAFVDIVESDNTDTASKNMSSPDWAVGMFDVERLAGSRSASSIALAVAYFVVNEQEGYWHGFVDSALRRDAAGVAAAVAEEGIHDSTPSSTFGPQSDDDDID